MLRRWIQQLRHKPKPVRDNIAMGVAGSFTAVVMLMWLVSAPQKLLEPASTLASEQGTFSVLLDQIKSQTAAVADSVAEATRSVSDAADKTAQTEEGQLGSATRSAIPAATSTSTSTEKTATTTSRAIRISTTTATQAE